MLERIEWPAVLMQFLHRPVPIFIHLAASRSGLPPFGCRGYGFRAEPELERLWIYILKSQWLRLNDNLQMWLAALLTSGADNESYQFKGAFTEYRPVTKEDNVFLERQCEYTSRYFPHLFPLLTISPSDCLAVGLQVNAVYAQTPGPHAGSPVFERSR